MSEPKFSVGEWVRCSADDAPIERCQVVDIQIGKVGDVSEQRGRCARIEIDSAGYWYGLSHADQNSCFHESRVHPLPPQEVTTWDECVWRPLGVKA